MLRANEDGVARAILIETPFRIESSLSYSKHSVGTRSNRNSPLLLSVCAARPTNFRRFAISFAFSGSFVAASQMTTHAPELPDCSADLVCYSRRRTCVPPSGFRATAPAQPRLATQWCLGIAPVIFTRRTLPCSTASQANRPSPSLIPAVIEAQVKGVCCARAHANGK